MLVVHVPHASITIPVDVRDQFTIPWDRVEAEAKASADLHTDTMAKEAWPGAEIICAEVSRIVVDVERYADDAVEEMAEVGRGAIYTHDHQGKHIRTCKDRDDLLARYYYPHWERLRAAAKGAVLIDLHTYPAEAWPIERHSSGARPEIDLGFTEGLTPMGWVDDLTAHFQAAGYSVGHNTPYSGVIDAGAAAAVMIEIRRDLVSDWARLTRTLSTMPMPSV
jgi:N-formylglutamate amidohydrolase